MRVKKIKIRNYKGILDQEIEFNQQVNVFIGGNRAGKTSLLEAIVISLIKLTPGLVENSNTLKLTNNDINYSKIFASILCHIEVDQFKSTIQKREVSLFSKMGILPLSVEEKNNNLNLSKYSIELKEQFSTRKFDLPIIKFYPVNRGALKYVNNTNNSVYLSSQLEAWANIIHQDISYSKLFNWFFDNETKELRMQRDANNFSLENPQIKYVRRTIANTLKILDGADYIVKSDKIKRIGTNQLVPILSLQKKNESTAENLDNKSDGEKAIITLVADIAYNLSIAKDFSTNEDYLASPGIVLIDEIEAHLHPNWQRKIVPLLTDLFPNIQFFITTHSPQVVAAVNSENIFVCEDFKFSKLAIKSKGLDSNSLLKHVFNATERPQQYVDLLQQFDQIIEESQDINKLEAIIENIKDLTKEDKGTDVSQLIGELELQLEAYKFDLEHEID